MVKTATFDKNGLKKGPWSEDEDDKLKAYIQRYGHWNWRLLPKYAGLSRCGKSCRLRWMNHLRPDLKHGNFTKQEDDLIVELHNKLGNKWSEMAKYLLGRTDNEIKNRWNTYLKKEAKKQQDVLRNEHVLVEPDQDNTNENLMKRTDSEFQENKDHFLLGGSPLSYSSTNISSSWLAGSSDDIPVNYMTTDDFWAESFLPGYDSTTLSSDKLFLPSNSTYTISCHDMIMWDEFVWSSMDSYILNTRSSSQTD